MSDEQKRRRIFLLSPANAGGDRARLLMRPGASFDLAARLQRQGAPLGEAFTFISGLYFRGKVAYAAAFAAPPEGVPGAFVITSGCGLVPPETVVTMDQLRQIASVPIDAAEARYRQPLENSCRILDEIAGPDCDFVLLGSVATLKYLEPMFGIFGHRLLFPEEFVGRGDMSRGGLLLRCARGGTQLTYVPLGNLTRHGKRPPKLPKLGHGPRESSAMSRQKNRESEILEVARNNFGFESLRPGQAEAVSAVLDGHDTLVVQPTGSGKSAIYQIAGLMIDGATVVVSPLIALQKDQVDAIEGVQGAEAVAINSAQPAPAIREGLKRVDQGKVEFILLAPEQLRKTETLENLLSANVSLFVVDEAHCISEWGHDFRPDYLSLGHVIEALGHPHVLALTATATPRVRREIVDRLGMRRPKVFIQSFDRPNIYLRVDHFKTEAEKRDALVHRARWADKPGIIYTGTRRAAEEIMESLAAEQIEALYYHGGMAAAERHQIQEKFMSGEAQVIVATNAFGMGIDKPDVRFVYHYDPSDSLDSYYQEIGRAGRDGDRAEAILFYREADIGAQSFKTGEGKLDTQTLEELASRIAENNGPVDPAEVAAEVGLSRRKVTSALQRLEDAGAAEADPAEAARLAAEEQQRRNAARRQRLEQMRRYAQTTGCRRELLLHYLGDRFHGPCRFCDNCEAASGKVTVDPGAGTRREVT